MYRSVFLIIIFSLMSRLSYAFDTGHDLLKKCEAVVELQNMDELKVKLDNLKKSNVDGDFDNKKIKLINELAISTRHIKAAQCLSFLSGFAGANSISPLTHKGRKMFCIPKDLSLNEAASLTVDWMHKNMDKLNFRAHEVLAMSNIVNFPCFRA